MVCRDKEQTGQQEKAQARDSGIILQAKGIYKSFPHDGIMQEVLRGIDISVSKGEFVAIMGPSGCGKSTLLHIIGLMLSASKADCISLEGMDTLKLTEYQRSKLRREKIGFLFQRFNLIDVLDARDNLKLSLKIRRKKVDDDLIDDMLELVGLTDRASYKPEQLSTGQQQRLAFVRAIIHQPTILLADEPTGNLDSENAESVMSLIKEYNRKHNQTTVMVTHNPEIANQADRIVYMKDGKIVG